VYILLGYSKNQSIVWVIFFPGCCFRVKCAVCGVFLRKESVTACEWFVSVRCCCLRLAVLSVRCACCSEVPFRRGRRVKERKKKMPSGSASKT
jgi:hypothetical protein